MKTYEPFAGVTLFPVVIVQDLLIYIGLKTKGGTPWCRLSKENFLTVRQADMALRTNTWTVNETATTKPVLVRLLHNYALPPYALFGTFLQNLS